MFHPLQRRDHVRRFCFCTATAFICLCCTLTNISPCLVRTTLLITTISLQSTGRPVVVVLAVVVAVVVVVVDYLNTGTRQTCVYLLTSGKLACASLRSKLKFCGLLQNNELHLLLMLLLKLLLMLLLMLLLFQHTLSYQLKLYIAGQKHPRVLSLSHPFSFSFTFVPTFVIRAAIYILLIQQRQQ